MSCAEIFPPLLQSLVQRQGAGLYAQTHNAVLIWYMPWNINSRAQRAITS